MTKRPYKKNKLSRFLRERREELGLSTTDVETLSKEEPKEYRISQAFIWQVEKQGATPSPYKLLTLARIYKIPVAEIYSVIGGKAEDLCSHGAAEHKFKKYYKLHLYLEELLAKEDARSNWISGNILTFYAQMTGKQPDLASYSTKGKQKTLIIDDLFEDSSGRPLSERRRGR